MALRLLLSAARSAAICRQIGMTDPRGRHTSLKRPEEPEDPNSMHHGGSFKKYMQFKNQKLREQFRDEATRDKSDDSRKIFSGISIHVNGFTNPSHQVGIRVRRFLGHLEQRGKHCAIYYFTFRN